MTNWIQQGWRGVLRCARRAALKGGLYTRIPTREDAAVTSWRQARRLIKALGNNGGSIAATLPPKRGIPMRTERRLAPRYPFLAMAEIIDEKENARKSSQDAVRFASVFPFLGEGLPR